MKTVAIKTTGGSVAQSGVATSSSRPNRGLRRPNAHLAVALLLLSTSLGGAAFAEEKPEGLRLCADPENLPFSSNKPERPGLYLEIGQALGQALARPVTTVWNLTYFGKRALRTTLLAGQCDASIGLPADQDFMGPRIIFSKPLLQVGYAIVTPKALMVSTLDDLKGRRVAVQFNSTPQSLLATRDDITAVTFREPEEAMQALADRKVDAAFIWGPIAGYDNKFFRQDAFNVVPVAGRGMQWPAAIGFARGQTALRDEVDRAIDSSRPTITLLEVKYGFPSGPPIELSASDTPLKLTTSANSQQYHVAPLGSHEQGLAQAGTSAAQLTAPQPPSQAAGPSTGGNPAEIAEGREIFNGICSHCHGPDAVQAERRINLRLLRHRYAEKMDETYRYIVTHGRPEKGMPNWKEVLTDAQFDKILAFLHSVQTE